ncbi:anti-sigma-B factor antagonist RsbV [Fictibacillus macauensis ZFHKF-1]|uniref:Anti-sigma factor antagonist n=1 Tax=Fictibacillus macauensis ZFHKF-1 TaxID=1196324 RepID=I8UKL9_9BACL|nr:STAS domain-containing protein [Fictibacillus macauensis]EIT87430.1 anti-sigma-B factor antagonist RsbV [Fictibacillus macauensis ZFHKF-1]
MNLHITQDTIDTIDHLQLVGEVDAYTAPKLKEVLVPLTEKQGATIVIDLQQVDYMDSTGLGIFVGALKSTKKNDGTMKLSGMTERVKRLFEITGLTEVMDIDNEVKGEAR